MKLESVLCRLKYRNQKELLYVYTWYEIPGINYKIPGTAGVLRSAILRSIYFVVSTELR